MTDDFLGDDLAPAQVVRAIYAAFKPGKANWVCRDLAGDNGTCSRPPKD